MTEVVGTDERLRLAGLRDELLRARAQLLAVAHDRVPAGAADAERDGAALVEREAVAQLDRLQRQALAEIDAALDRFEAGTYGTCVECAAAIPLERLEIVPTASRCLSCQLQREGARR